MMQQGNHGRFIKTVHVWMLLAAVAGMVLEGCGMMGQVFHIDDSPSPTREAVVSTLEPAEVCPPAWWQRGETSVAMSPSSGTVMPKPSSMPSTGQSPEESMDRLIREMEATPQSHEELEAATRIAEGVPQKKATGFLVGRGSAESRESAEAQARLNIVKSIEVKISDRFMSQARETSDRGFEYSVESTVVERVDLSLTGFSTPKVVMCGNQWYALALLDRAKAETAWRADMRVLDDKAKAFYRLIDGHKQKNDALALLLTQYQLTVALETISQIQQRLPRLTGQPESEPLRAGDVQDAKSAYESLLRSFEFRVVHGDQQDAILGRPLDNPLEVKLTASLEEGNEVPVSRVPVLFSFDRGKGEVDSRVETDHEGHARASVHRVEPAKGPNDTGAVITAHLDVADLGQSLPSSVRQQLHKYVDAQVLRFRIRLPRGCASINPFDHQLYELACNLVRQVNSSVGKHTVVHGFVERGSRRRLPLSDRIEDALGNGLARTGQLKVLPHPASGNDSASRDPEVEVSGVYEWNGENLLVQAELTRLGDDGMKAMEAADETTIPREALPKTALSSFPHSRSTGQLLVPNHSDFATHDEWVTAFWHHRNPKPEFQTSIRAKKSLYQDKEKAVFEFETGRDCYLWVFAIDVEGNGALLLPNKHQPKLRHVRADAGWVRIPGINDGFSGFDFPISPPFGSERVKTVCTTDPIHIVAPEHISNPPDGLPMFVFSRDNQRFHDVGETPEQRDVRPVDWSEAHTQFTTIPKGRQTTRGLDGLRKRGLISKEE